MDGLSVLKNKPEIRFEGFDEAWVGRKLSKFVAYRASHLTASDANDNGNYYLYDANSIIGKTDSEPMKTKYITIIKDGAGVGRIRKMPANTMFIGTMGALTADGSDLGFVFALLTRFNLGQSCSGSTIPHIYFKDYGNNKYFIPQKEEQIVIGQCFEQLDHLIILQQRKCDRLQALKKAMLEKMFPKAGSDVPEIRFSGFTDAWEQRKLGEIIQLGGSGGTPSAANPNYYGGEIPFLSIADIEGRDITHTAKTLTEEGLRNSAAWIVPAGAVSFAMYASVGKVGIIRQDTATSQAFYNMIFEDDAIRDFVFTRLEKADVSFEWEPYISTGTQRNLNADKVKAFTIAVPGNREAAKIGRYFENLDHLITLHQHKLQKLQECKKALLEKMFVEGES